MLGLALALVRYGFRAQNVLRNWTSQIHLGLQFLLVLHHYLLGLLGAGLDLGGLGLRSRQLPLLAPENYGTLTLALRTFNLLVWINLEVEGFFSLVGGGGRAHLVVVVLHVRNALDDLLGQLIVVLDDVWPQQVLGVQTHQVALVCFEVLHQVLLAIGVDPF